MTKVIVSQTGLKKSASNGVNFWQHLPKPFFVLAPMADVTDASFRRMIAKYSKFGGVLQTNEGGLARPLAKQMGGPDVMWTEFVSADGLVRATEEGKKKLMADLIYAEEERPIVAQLFSSNEAHMEEAAALCSELGFDGIDINMGCPDKSIEKQGCGSAMIKTPEKAKAIIEAAKRGSKGLPVSVKTRLGYNRDELETWIPHLLSCEIAALTLHARTRKEMSKVPARWERIARAVEIRDSLGVATKIIGNGDVESLEDAREKAKLFHADGVMLGRAIFGNPWLFHPSKRLPERMTLSESSLIAHRTTTYDSLHNSTLPRPSSQEDALSTQPSPNGIEVISLKERFEALIEHTKLFEELLPHKSFALMKKHYKAYINGFDGAKELRTELMELPDAVAIEARIREFLKATQ